MGLAAPRLAVEDQVLRVAHERQREHLVAAPAVGERDVGPVEALDRLGNGEPRLPEQARPLRPVAVRDLRLEHRRARGHLARRRGGEEGADRIAGYEEGPRGAAEGRLCGLTLRARLRHGRHLPRAVSAPCRRRPGRLPRRTRRARLPMRPWRPRGRPRRGRRLRSPRASATFPLRRRPTRAPRSRRAAP